MHRLTLIVNGKPGRVYELSSGEVILGRESGVHVQNADRSVSRRHARLSWEGGRFWLEDLGSSNGTYLNGSRITGRQPLQTGDEVGLGQTVTLQYNADIHQSPPSLARTSTEVLQELAELGLPVRGGGPQDAPAAQLLIAIGDRSPQSVTLQSSLLTIGRLPENDIVIGSRQVSRRHGRIERTGRGWMLVQLPEAGNPILFQGQPVGAGHLLRHGDRLQIHGPDPAHNVEIEFIDPTSSAQGHTAAAPAPGHLARNTRHLEARITIQLDPPMDFPPPDPISSQEESA